ncbi:MAG: MATE family efflux transporter [Betaproteobacteria bacterium]|nr:MATE family efflux transporter [Betaproteobacteria bacterium]
MGLTPIAAGHFGAGRLSEIGDDVGQAAWVALILAAIGIPLLWWSDPWLGLTQPDPALHDPLTQYLQIIALAMPSTLLYSVFFTLNSATSRPAVTMAINLVMLTVKWPLNLVFMDGIDGLIAPMGAVGCAVSTAILSWVSLAVAFMVLLIDRRYRDFHVRLRQPVIGKISELLRIGFPIGAGYLIEVTSFTLMALLIGRFGTIASASHQVAANLATLIFMMPLALSNATSILAAQSIGAGNEAKARAWVWAGMRLVMGIAAVIVLVLLVLQDSLARLYAEDPLVQQFARVLIIYAAICHMLDALQCLLYSSLRAWRITFTPMLVYGISLWGFGVCGGWWFSHTLFAPGPSAPEGFWMGNFLGLSVACIGLGLLLRRRFLNPIVAIKP